MAWTLIRGGTVVDGTGSPPFQADVCIRDGVIDAVGPDLSAPEGAQVMDAAGKLITPGFINMHSHSDCSAAMYPNMESTLGQGITTEFAGHCGLGVAPVQHSWLYMFPEKKAFTKVMPEPPGGINPYNAYLVPTQRLREPFAQTYGQELDWTTYGQFLEHLRRVGLGANLAVVAGQAQIRLQAMGTDYHRDATETEIAAMEDALSEAMDGGALGLSLGLDYEPGLFAGREELLRLMKLVAARGGIVTAHTRSRSHPYYGHAQSFLDGLRPCQPHTKRLQRHPGPRRFDPCRRGQDAGGTGPSPAGGCKRHLGCDPQVRLWSLPLPYGRLSVPTLRGAVWGLCRFFPGVDPA